MIWCAVFQGQLPQAACEFLTESEARVLGARAVPKRRDDFARGRWAAKNLLSAWFEGTRVRDHQVLPDDRGVPQAHYLSGVLRDVSVSISHTRGVAAAAIVDHPAIVGVDVERPIENPWPIACDYFSSTERQMMECGSSERIAARIWSAKEAVVKVLGEGLRLSLMAVGVDNIGEPGQNGWRRIDTSPQQLTVWSRDHAGCVVTVAVHGHEGRAPVLVDISESTPPIGIGRSSAVES